MVDAPLFEEIVENFEFLDDWEDRYRYIIELGKEMPPVPDVFKTSATKVDGCASQVWLIPRLAADESGAARVTFEGDSDAMIVRGLIAMLRALYHGRSPAEVLAIDAPAQLARLGLDSHLSSQRSNGVRAMVARLREFAAAI